jgi:hypothetical protein
VVGSQEQGAAPELEITRRGTQRKWPKRSSYVTSPT